MTSNWKYTVKGFKDLIHREDLTLHQTANRMAELITASKWYRERNNVEGLDDSLQMYLEELSDAGEAEDVEWFDHVLNVIYDEADYDRVWLA